MDYQQPQQGAQGGGPAPQPGYQQPQYPGYQQPYQGYPQQPAYDPNQYPQPGYQPPQPGGYPQYQPGASGGSSGPNPLAIVGMILGIVSMVLVIVHFIVNPYVQAVGVITEYGSGGALALIAQGFGFSQWFSVLPLVGSIGGLVLSVMGRKAAAQKGGKGMATTGLVFSIIALVFAFIQFIACGLCIAMLGEYKFVEAIYEAV